MMMMMIIIIQIMIIMVVQPFWNDDQNILWTAVSEAGG